MLPNALTFHRFAKRLETLGVPLVPEVLTAVSRHLHHCSISLEANVGDGVELGYGGMGVTVDAGVRIGKGAFICQDVTLASVCGEGAPSIGEGVMIGAGARVIGKVTIGANASVGANAVVLEDVPPGVTVVGVPARPKSATARPEGAGPVARGT